MYRISSLPPFKMFSTISIYTYTFSVGLGRICFSCRMPDIKPDIAGYCLIIRQYLAGFRISGRINLALTVLIRHCRISGPTLVFSMDIASDEACLLDDHGPALFSGLSFLPPFTLLKEFRVGGIKNIKGRKLKKRLWEAGRKNM